MSGSRYIVTCPLCGKTLLKGYSGSNIEIACPKCRVELLIELIEGRVAVETRQVEEENSEGRMEQVKRALSYRERMTKTPAI